MGRKAYSVHAENGELSAETFRPSRVLPAPHFEGNHLRVLRLLLHGDFNSRIRYEGSSEDSRELGANHENLKKRKIQLCL